LFGAIATINDRVDGRLPKTAGNGEFSISCWRFLNANAKGAANSALKTKFAG
jgi:hypothetical protein